MKIESKRKTLKKRNQKMVICGNIISEKGGWTTINIFGEPYERGFAHGFLLKKDLKRCEKVLKFLLKKELNMELDDYIQYSVKIVEPILKAHFLELYQEICGIADGAKKAGVNISFEFLISWNAYISLSSCLKPNNNEKCSAFIAVGNATEKGDIIMSHNTHSDFATGQLSNVIIYVTPKEGYPFVMQTSAGLVSSVTDWFLCSTGIIGCETTISKINYEPKFGYPYFCRIRMAMQYGKTFDDYVNIMSDGNAGDYACSWLLGDVNNNSIMLFELGLKHKNVEIKNNGVFYGMNSAIGDELREKETHDVDYKNITTSVGARNCRLNDLLNNVYYGKINIENGKKVISDHYDVHMNKNVRNNRSICNHCELDDEYCKRPPFYPYGCTDAKIVNSEMAKQLGFFGRFGSGCGRIFSVDEFVKKHPQHSDWKKVLNDFKNEKWVKIGK